MSSSENVPTSGLINVHETEDSSEPQKSEGVKVFMKKKTDLAAEIGFNLRKQEMLDEQRPKFGQYMHCKGTLLQTFDEPAELKGIYSLKFSPKGKYLITGYGSEPKNEINALDINNTGDSIASAGKDANIRIYDAETLALKLEYKRNTVPCEAAILGRDVSDTDDGGHFMRIFCVKYDTDQPNILISGGWDSTIKIWDTRVERYPVRNIYGPHICGDALDIMDNKILSGQWSPRDSLQLWDMGTARRIKTIVPDNRALGFLGEFLYTAKFMRGLEESSGSGLVRGDLVIAAGSGLCGLEVISIKENVVLATFPEEKPVIGSDQIGPLICFGGSGNALHFAQFKTGPLQEPPPPTASTEAVTYEPLAGLETPPTETEENFVSGSELELTN